MKTFVKILGQTGNLETEAKRYYYSLLKKKKKNNEITLKQDILPKIFKSTGQIDRSIDLCVLRNARHELFCVFGNFFQIFIFISDAGRRCKPSPI